MDVRYYEQERMLVIKFTEEIDEFKVKEIRRKADYEIERFMPKRVVFDFNSVVFMDSSGIGMVIGRYKKTKMLGGILEVANLTNSVKKVFEISGLLNLVKEVDLEEEIEKVEKKKYIEKLKDKLAKEEVV